MAHPSVADAREVFEARALIEGVLVQRFVERATPDDVQRLADCIEAEEEARRQGDHALALRLSGRFHLLIAEAAQHRTFHRLLKKLISRTSLILMSYAPVERIRPTFGDVPLRWVNACRCDAHRQVLSALQLATQGGSPTAEGVQTAVDDMRDHLGAIEASLCFNDPTTADRETGDFLGRVVTGRHRFEG